MEYYNKIKQELINNEINRRVKSYSINRSDLTTYYNVGKLLNDAGKHYGEGIIKEYSKKLTLEIGKKYSITSLKYIRQFYNFSKSHSVSDQLTYTHYKVLLPLKNNEEIDYYNNICIKNNLSVRELIKRIKSNEYYRLPENTKNKLIKKEKSKVEDFIKNPIMIKNTNYHNIISEKILQRLILEDIPSFLEELGLGFAFIKNEYKIKIGNRYNYIDILLYNVKFKCYVVVELKITDLKKEHIGQILTYMNYVDKNIKTITEDKTIGIIICKKDNKFIMEYCSDERILSKEYELI